MSQFKVGDVVEAFKGIKDGIENGKKNIGREGAICKLEDYHVSNIGRVWFGYVVSYSATEHQIWPRECLRLKRPPEYPEQFTAGEWDLIPWKPSVKEKI